MPNPRLLFSLFFIFLLRGLSAQTYDLRLDTSDLWLVPRISYTGLSGYDLYIRQKERVQSVLLVEQNSKLGLRTKEYDPMNGMEIRLWNGKPLTFSDGSYSITSSTPSNAYYDHVFHLYLPIEMVYGYNSPANAIRLTEDTILIIRTYSEKYNHQQARYWDNSFRLNQLVKAGPLPVYPSPPMPPVASATPDSRFSFKELRSQLQGNGIVSEEILQRLFGNDDYKLQIYLKGYFENIYTREKK